MPWKIKKQTCKDSKGETGTHIVLKVSSKNKKKESCHKNKNLAKSSIRARYANSKDADIVSELRDYFSSRTDTDYLSYDDHPLSTIEHLMDEDSPAPWDEDYEINDYANIKEREND